MTTYRRNIIVGVTVLTALASLAWMILKFGGNLASPFSPEQMFVRFRSDRADGLGTGSGIFYLGVEVGRITRIDLDPVNGGVTMTAMVNRQPTLPANVEGYIRINTFIGGSTSVMLETLGAPEGTLQPNAELVAKYVGLAVLPPELSEMAREISAAVRQYRETNVIVHIDEQVTRLGKVLDSIDSLVGDPQLREDVRQSLSNLRQTSEQVQRIAGGIVWHHLVGNVSGSDVDDDGLLDQVCYFRIEATGFRCNDTEGVLRGKLIDGKPLTGMDAVLVTPCS